MSCPSQEELFDAFVNGLDTSEVLRHAQGCPLCQEKLAELTQLREATQAALRVRGGEDFVESTLEKAFAPPAKPTWSPWALSMAAATALFMVVAGSGTIGSVGGFQQRGGGELQARSARKLGIQAFLHPREDFGARVPLTTQSVLRPEDGLSFEVFNRTGALRYMMIFGRDAKGELHWFYPAYTHLGTNPSSVTIPRTPQVTPLVEGVVPEEVAQGGFELVSVFSRERLYVQEVEKKLSQKGLSQFRQELEAQEALVNSLVFEFTTGGRK